MGFKTKFGLIWEEQTVKNKERKKRREEEKGGAKKGMETNLEYGF